MAAADSIVPDEAYQEFVSELFHENSKQHRSDARFIERILAANYDPTVRQMMGPTHKAYPDAEPIWLPTNFRPAERTFDEAMLNRRSLREFSRAGLSLRQMAKLLHFTYGVTGVLDAGDGFERPLRSAPSGGALFPIEIYALVQKVAGLESGIYHFDPSANCLELVKAGNPIPDLTRATYAGELKDAALAIALTGVSMKSRIKYGERGYRFMLLEAGHIMQNFLLTASAMNLSAFSVGGFVDDELDALLQLEDFDETSLYVAAVGKPRAGGGAAKQPVL